MILLIATPAIIALGVFAGVLAAGLAVALPVVLVMRNKKKNATPAEKPAYEPAPEDKPEVAAEPAPEPVKEKEPEAQPEVKDEPTPAAEEVTPLAEIAEEPVKQGAVASGKVPEVDKKAGLVSDEATYTTFFKQTVLNYSFKARLALADETTKGYYDELYRDFSTYNKVRFSTSWKHVSVISGRNTLAKFTFSGSKLCVSYALDPKELEDTKYGGTDVSDSKKFENTPYQLKLTSKRRLGYAKDLFALAAKDIERGGEDTAPEIPDEHDIQKLIDAGLIKLIYTRKSGKAAPAPIPEPAPEPVKEKEPEPVKEIAVAEPLPAEEEEYIYKVRLTGKTAIINVGALPHYFKAGEKVTLDEVKKRVSGMRNAKRLKVLGYGVLYQKFTIVADSVTPQAREKILKAGGKII